MTKLVVSNFHISTAESPENITRNNYDDDNDHKVHRAYRVRSSWSIFSSVDGVQLGPEEYVVGGRQPSVRRYQQSQRCGGVGYSSSRCLHTAPTSVVSCRAATDSAAARPIKLENVAITAVLPHAASRCARTRSNSLTLSHIRSLARWFALPCTR